MNKLYQYFTKIDTRKPPTPIVKNSRAQCRMTIAPFFIPHEDPPLRDLIINSHSIDDYTDILIDAYKEYAETHHFCKNDKNLTAPQTTYKPLKIESV